MIGVYDKFHAERPVLSKKVILTFADSAIGLRLEAIFTGTPE